MSTFRNLGRSGASALFGPHPPNASGLLDVGDDHQIYYEESGNPNGVPVLILHGGPGAGTNPAMRRYHNPEAYRIIMFDQRGCGRSLPHASLHANTTWHLVDDIERLRVHLGVDRWQLFGGSWGATLALSYAQTHPERVLSMILRGVFLMRRKEIEWFYLDGCNWLFPEAYQAFCDHVSADDAPDVLTAYYRRLTHPDRSVQLHAARAWSLWEGTTLSLIPDTGRLKLFDVETFALAFARIEAHYIMNGGFFERDGQLLENAGRLAGIPLSIVQGRYDVITPVRSAWELAARLPGTDLKTVPDAGHAMSEPGIVEALIAATNRHAAILSSG